MTEMIVIDLRCTSFRYQFEGTLISWYKFLRNIKLLNCFETVNQREFNNYLVRAISYFAILPSNPYSSEPQWNQF